MVSTIRNMMVTNSGQSVRLVQDASCVYRIKA